MYQFSAQYNDWRLALEMNFIQAEKENTWFSSLSLSRSLSASGTIESVRQIVCIYKVTTRSYKNTIKSALHDILNIGGICCCCWKKNTNFWFKNKTIADNHTGKFSNVLELMLVSESSTINNSLFINIHTDSWEDDRLVTEKIKFEIILGFRKKILGGFSSPWSQSYI